MPEKKHNHFLPRLILKNWITSNGKRDGVNVYDVNKNRIYISEPYGKRGFSFAIEDNLYVANIDGVRRVDVEYWFSDLENVLDQVINKLKNDSNTSLFKYREEMDRFVLSIVSIQHRTKIAINKNLELINKKPKIKKLLYEYDAKSDEQLILENIINASKASAAEFSNFELIIVKSKAESIIFGDNPYLQNVVNGFDFVPLTNRIYIGIRKTTRKSFYNYMIANDELLENFNTLIASNSHEWIISDSVQQLEKYSKFMNKDVKGESKFIKNTYPIFGSSFKRNYT
jgi:hypothetical protein